MPASDNSTTSTTDCQRLPPTPPSDKDAASASDESPATAVVAQHVTISEKVPVLSKPSPASEQPQSEVNQVDGDGDEDEEEEIYSSQTIKVLLGFLSNSYFNYVRYIYKIKYLQNIF